VVEVVLHVAQGDEQSVQSDVDVAEVVPGGHEE